MATALPATVTLATTAPPAAAQPGLPKAVERQDPLKAVEQPDPPTAVERQIPPPPTLPQVGPPTGPQPRAGYHHLGATTVGTWAGVSGRLTVADPGVRPGTFDFVAARFMARSADGTTWLEAGWAENGWLRDGKQRVYTYDTARKRWTFYNQYPLAKGDTVWIYVETTRGGNRGTHWSAWLWWGNRWRLLINQALPIGPVATIEQYVEVYVDPAAGGTIALPTSGFDNVQLKDRQGRTRYWREPDVPTGAGSGFGTYCLNWTRRFDTWSAATCT
jgi:hypothetical protein